MIKAATSELTANDVYKIGGKEYSLKEMAELIAEKYGVGVDYVPWPDVALKIESGDTLFDSEKLDVALGSNMKMKFKDWIK